MGVPEYVFGGFIALGVCGMLFIGLPWMILHYISKARSNSALSEEDGRMLEDLWRSAKTMERRIETMERLLEPEGTVIRPRPSTTSRGDMN
jgi:phage shock protein B